MLKQDQLPELTNDILSAVVKGLDQLDLFEHDGVVSAIPFGKIAAYLARKAIKIHDPDKALQHAVGTAFYASFIQAVDFFNLNRELPDAAQATLGSRTKTTTEFSYFSFRKEEFDIDNFHGNEVAAFYTDIFKKLLAEYRISEENAIKIEKYIKDYVKLNFLLILEKNALAYAEAHNYLNNSSYQEIRARHLLDRYQTDLKNLINEPVWNDQRGLTLQNLYVKPHFKIHKYCFKDTDERNRYDYYQDDNGFVDIDYPYKSIHEFLHQTLLGSNPLKLKNASPQMIFLLGYPGQGKTSFCKKLLYDTYSHDLPLDKDIFLVKFRNISRVSELINNPFSVLSDSISELVEDKVSENKLKESILLLDGLDELYMKENLRRVEIDDLVKNFLWEIKTYPELKVIITSRYGYLDLNKLKERNVLICQLEELNTKQQKKWLSNYKAYHPECVLT